MKISKRSLYALALVLFISSQNQALSQRAVQLTKISNDKKVIIPEGKRVAYKLKGELKGNFGILESVQDSSVIVNGKVLTLEQFSHFGKRKKGSGFWSGFLILLGTGAMVDGLTYEEFDPCPSCTGEEPSGEGMTIFIRTAVGAGITALGINTAVKNSARDLEGPWKMEIVREEE